MKFSALTLTVGLTVFLAVTLSPSACAQTQIGGVTLTRPGAPAPAVRGPVAPAGGRAAQTTADDGRDTMSSVAVPAGAQEIRGRVQAASGVVRLPAGSTVNVSVSDLTRPAQVMAISFGTSRLSTPYQLVFSAGRLNRAHTYAVQANVVDASGKVLYTSDRSAVVPADRHAVVNVTVR